MQKFRKQAKTSMGNYQNKKLLDKKIEIETHWIYLAEEVGFKVAKEFHIE